MLQLSDSHVHENHDTEPEPQDWPDFAANAPDLAARIDADFFCDDTPTDAIEAFCEISNRLRRGDVTGAKDVADRWRFRCEQHRADEQDKALTTWPRPAA